MNKISHDSEVPAYGQQVITACAFIHTSIDGVRKVFLPKRATAKKFLPDVFEVPGGHIEFGEDIVAGLKREIKEEFNMDISVGDPFAAFTYSNNIKGSHSIEVIYFAQFTSPLSEMELHSEDHSMFGWFTQDEILTSIVSDIKTAEDVEIQAIIKGFSLLNNNSLKFR